MDLGSGIRDPGSGKNLFRIPDPGVKQAPDPGSGSATLVTNGHFEFSRKTLDPDPRKKTKQISDTSRQKTLIPTVL
jgi:hypothetical protein